MKELIKNRKFVYYILVFVLLTIIIISASVLFYQYRQGEIKKEKYIELSAIGELKMNQIVSWRDEKIADALVLSHDIILNNAIDRFFKYKTAADSLLLSQWFNEYKKQKQYISIILSDRNSNFRISDCIPFNFDRLLFEKALRDKKPVMSDLYNINKSLFLDIYAPLADAGTSEAPSNGMIILRINPSKYLYPVIQSWPTPSKSSEILLFRVEGDSLVYLNKLRHINNEPFKLKFPVKTGNLPAALAARGVRGIVIGNDYRGEEVLADLREIPGTGWLVVTKVDLAEIFAPLDELYFNVALFAVFLIAAAAVVIILLWKNQKALLYKKLYNIELEKQALEKNFEYLTKYANDAIFLFDYSGKILYANERASGIYGYSLQELSGMNVYDLRADKDNPSTEQILLQIQQSGGLIYEALHKRKDGHNFYIESSSRFIEVSGIKYLQSIIRDISEKKTNEAELQKTLKEKDMLLKEIHHRVKNNLQLTISLLNLQASFISEEFVKKMFIDSQNRIKSMALLHEQLYRSNISSINSESYFNSLIPQLVNTYNVSTGKISVHTKIEERMLSLDTVIPLGLIITEIISNIFKYAFPGNRNGNVIIEFKSTGDNVLQLIISDDGTGLPENIDYRNTNTLGFQLIHSLAEQLNGKVEITNRNGVKFEITVCEVL